MMTLGILILMVMLLASVISIGIRMAWGATKFFFGLGLFWFCPLLFVLAVLFGGFSHTVYLAGVCWIRWLRRLCWLYRIFGCTSSNSSNFRSFFTFRGR